MPYRVLVLTPDTQLGELVRQVLVDAHHCQVVLAQNNHQVQRLARQVVFDLAILEEDASEDGLPELERRLLEYQPHLCIAHLRRPADISFANGSARQPGEVSALLHHLREAIQQHDMAESVTDGGAAVMQAQSKINAPPNWMLEPGESEQRLKRIRFPDLVYAAMLVRRESLWAYRGALPRALAGDLAQALVQSWSREQDAHRGAGRAGGDMLRFVKLGARQEFLLYARGLRFGFVLGLAFPPTTPFHAARSHMEQILRDLYAGALNGEASQSKPVGSQLDGAVSPGASPTLEPAAIALEAGFEQGAALEAALPDFNALLGDVPEPTPQSMRSQVPGSERIFWSWQAEADDFPEEASSWVQSDKQGNSDQPGENAYAFVLSPHCKQHALRGQFAAHVYQRMSELAYERGWRLQGISVRPNYLRFIAVLAESESRELILQTMRQELSSSLFKAFPELAECRQGEDFWAADYLACEAGRPLLAQELRRYLQRVGRWLTEPVYRTGSQDLNR